MSEDHRSPYRVTEAARRLGISDQQTLKAIKRGELDAFRVGRLWLVHPASVDRVLRGGKKTAASQDKSLIE
jgi:excisionase family DNA binding protein